MTEEEARKLLLAYLEKYAVTDELPLAWIGPMVKETSENFFFESAVYKEGEIPGESVGGYDVVNKHTGVCAGVLPPPGPPVDLNQFTWETGEYSWRWAANPRKMI